jgi:8-oxo-dGTP diphosphatase
MARAGGRGVRRGAAAQREVRRVRRLPAVRQVAIAVIRAGDRILVGRRRDSQHLGGRDEFPGGHRERGETLAACAVREVLEETGLRVRVLRRLASARHVDAVRRVRLTFFECAPIGSRRIDSARARRGLRWVEAAELSRLRFPPANRALLRLLRRGERGA